jgi:hypothetical protein
MRTVESITDVLGFQKQNNVVVGRERSELYILDSNVRV